MAAARRGADTVLSAPNTTALRSFVAADSALTLGLLGELELTAGDETPLAGLLVQPKRLALLIYLVVALPRGFRRRDELLALFWPDSDADHARNSLRQSLHELRGQLPPDVLITRGDEVGVCRARFSVDVQDFEDFLDSGQEEDALALYQGDLLPGFHVPGCSEFEIWLEMERERLRRRAVRGALVLARRRQLDGEAARAAEWARFAEKRAPFDEGVLREVLELLADLGNRAEAVRLCEAAAERFREELGTDLSPSTKQVSRAIASDRLGRELAVHPGASNPTIAIRSPLRHAISPPTRPRLVSAEARQLYLQARNHSGQRSPATIIRAIELFEQALRLSPDYAEAHSGLAFALTQATVYVNYLPREALPRVQAHARRAIRLDPSVGEAHAMLAQATICYDYDWNLAEEMYLRALEVDPVSEVACCGYALYFLTPMGRLDEALAVLDRARDSMPNLLGISTFYGMACAFGRRFERARQEAESVIAIQPGFVQAHWVRGMALEGLGDFDTATAAFETAVSLTNGSSLMLAMLGRVRARAGDRGRAEEILSQLERRNETAGPGAYFAAVILARLGRQEAALDQLYAAYRQRNPLLIFSGLIQGLDPLRGERRFQELLLRIGLQVRERVA